MKVIISGNITNKEIQTTDFEAAEELLKGLGHDTVSTMRIDYGVGANARLKKQVIKDMEIMIKCDAVFLLSNWKESSRSKILKVMAEEFGKTLLFETSVSEMNEKIQQIKDAIFEVTGLKFEQYTTDCKDRDKYFARMIFVNCCREYEGLQPSEIAKIVNRDSTLMSRYFGKYKDEVRLNKGFRLLAESVENILSECVSV